MSINIFWGLIIPFIGTATGSACVFFMKRNIKDTTQKILTGFAAGVMFAASVWSLLIPAVEQSESIFPALIGFWEGIGFLLLLDNVIPHIHMDTGRSEGPRSNIQKTTMMLLAVTIHNIPEGMAVGVVFAGMLSGSAEITAGAAFALSIGIAIQNFPEGAIISMPLHAEGRKKGRAFVDGMLSGAVEPLGGLLTIIAAGFVVPMMPYLLAFAAGAMIYVVVEELIPEMSAGGHSNVGVVMFAVGFSVMMALDILLG